MISESAKKKIDNYSLIDKVFYKAVLKNIFSDPFHVEFWDGEHVTYGEGESKFTIILNEPIAKSEILANPSLAFGEAFMHKKIELVGNIEDVIFSLYTNKGGFFSSIGKKKKIADGAKNNIKKSKENVGFHYDIGNDFYKLWLDETMTYSCGYFKTDQDTLAQAQINKVNHVLKKISLKEGQTLLDIDCGWGQLMIAAAKQYKVKAMGVTLSDEQYTEVTRKIKEEGLEDLVTVKLMDYRKIKGVKFDRIVSVGMLEHVGKECLPEYFDTVNSLLVEDGISLLHCITGVQRGGNNPWIEKYIFPGGYVPAISELIQSIASERMCLLDAESLRRHYWKTLQCWTLNFENVLDEISKSKDEVFIRMWRLYLNSCAASFHAGNIDIHQLVFSKGPCDAIPWTRDYIYQ